ncbi:MAG: acyl carrier protein [Bacteroidetes bacterium]|jgi:acyl carrier protein|nr:acyl carrier protein [Bacteroidota bacterium]
MSALTLPEIKLEIKRLILDTLNMGTINPDSIRDDIPLLSGDNVITIDSIDVIEVVIAIQKRFNVRMDDQNLARHIVNTVDTMAEFVYAQQQKNDIH